MQQVVLGRKWNNMIRVNQGWWLWGVGCGYLLFVYGTMNPGLLIWWSVMVLFARRLGIEGIRLGWYGMWLLFFPYSVFVVVDEVSVLASASVVVWWGITMIGLYAWLLSRLREKLFWRFGIELGLLMGYWWMLRILPSHLEMLVQGGGQILVAIFISTQLTGYIRHPWLGSSLLLAGVIAGVLDGVLVRLWRLF